MSTNYPNDYDSYPTWQDLVDIIAAAIINNIQDAIVAIEQTLGKNPQGSYTTVKDRLDAIQPGGRWELVEEVTITEGTDSYTFSGLDGDSDEEYLLVFRIRSQVGSTNIYRLRFNGDSGGNYDWQRQRTHGSAVDASSLHGSSFIEIAIQADAGCFIVFGEAHIFAKSGYARPVRCHSQCDDSPEADTYLYYFGGHWRNTTDNITSISIESANPNGLGPDTILRLYKKT